jgi:hypothetical protein
LLGPSHSLSSARHYVVPVNRVNPGLVED